MPLPDYVKKAVENDSHMAQGLPDYVKAAVGGNTRNRYADAKPQGTLTPAAPTVGGNVLGVGETAATIATAALAGPISGIAGLATSFVHGPESGSRVVEDVQRGLTYKPRTEPGQDILGGVAETLQPVGAAISGVEKWLGDFAFDLTGSPEVAALAATVPTAIGEIIGLKGLKAVRRGTQLIDADGSPTRVLRQALNKEGLDYDLMSPEVKRLIPSTADPTNLPGGNSVRPEVENIIKNQIKDGARDDALAPLKVKAGKVIADKRANAAIKQGFSPGFVQSVKTSNQATKAKMLKMTAIMRKIKKQERIGLDIRPTDVVGDSVTDRIKFIKDKAYTARRELDTIARNELGGKSIDTTPVIETLTESLADLDVILTPGPKGVPTPQYKTSLISKDRSSRRVITDLIDLMAEGGAPDALRFHKLKRQLDIMIDFNKKSAMGLTDAGKKVLKKVRKSLNDSIRDVSPDYARVNDVLSESLTTMGDLDKAVGTIDLFGEGANKAIGQKMRALLSNQQGRIKLENSLDQLEGAVKNLGGKFDDDIKDLVMFADGLDSKFGTVAKTSLAGQTEQAINRAVTMSPKTTVVEAVGKVIGGAAEKVRGVNDFNAFESVENLLRRHNM